MKYRKSFFVIAVILFTTFVLFTAAVMKVDVEPATTGDTQPGGTPDLHPGEIGLAKINKPVMEKIGYNDTLFNISEILGFVCILFAAAAAGLGLYYLIKGKGFRNVPIVIYLTGLVYVAIGAFYVLFNNFIVNYRPVYEEIGGKLEAKASYPSSHTLLAIVVMSTAIVLTGRFVKNRKIAGILKAVEIIIMAATVITRFLSGAHWLTDYIGSILLGTSLIFFYKWGIAVSEKRKQEK